MSERNRAVRVFGGALMGVLMIGVSGCDFLDGFFHRKAEIDAVVNQPPQPEIIPQNTVVREPTKGNCATLRHYIMTRLKMLTSRQAETNKELDMLKTDRWKFSERVKALSEENLADRKGTSASGLVLLLNDGEINELAYKYLGNDFAVLRHEFSEKIRNVIALEQKSREDLERKRAKIKESVAEAQDQVERVRKENAVNVSRLRKEIEAKEKKLKSLRADLFGKKASEAQNCKDEIRHVEEQISQLKAELQQEMNSSRVRDANRNLEMAGKQASRDDKRLDEMAARGGKNDVTSEFIVEKYEKMTIHRLDSALLEKNLKIQKGQKLLAEQILFLESVTSGLETLDSAGLKRVRAEVETELSKTVEASDK